MGSRVAFAGAVALLALYVGSGSMTGQQPQQEQGEQPNFDVVGVKQLTQILVRPTDRSIVLSVLAPTDMEAYVEYGEKPGAYAKRSVVANVPSGTPVEMPMEDLRPNATYFYRLQHRPKGGSAYQAEPEYSFRTQRAPGSTFTFSVQGDSHPERSGIGPDSLNRMYHPDLYTRTLQMLKAEHTDFHIMLGDDFNVDPLFNRNMMNTAAISQLYINQRSFLGTAGSSVPIFHVNGNHEQAMAYLLDGTPNSPSVLAGVARNRYFPMPAPDRFYSGDKEPVEFVGLRRDYYAWTWGDALFVTIDPYWHSPVQLDAGIGGQQARRNGRGRGGALAGNALERDGWTNTMGDAQYQWLKTTLEQSKAKFKFVFAHHVLGTGRGGVAIADLYEWGGKNRNGEWEFDKKRPGWELPVHQLMVKNGVTIFFQGHDHLFAREEKDGLIYQETPNPADAGYRAYNEDAYKSDVLPNAGFLRVTVTADTAKVDYLRSYLPKDENAQRKHGEIAFSYTVRPRPAR